MRFLVCKRSSMARLCSFCFSPSSRTTSQLSPLTNEKSQVSVRLTHFLCQMLLTVDPPASHPVFAGFLQEVFKRLIVQFVPLESVDGEVHSGDLRLHLLAPLGPCIFICDIDTRLTSRCWFAWSCHANASRVILQRPTNNIACRPSD